MRRARFFAGTFRVLAGGSFLTLCVSACVGSSDDPESGQPVIELELKKSCGDGVCGPNEHCRNCFADCGPCSPACGDGFCSPHSESCATCPADCGACPAACGDGACNGIETCSSCPADCGACPPACGDGACNGTETCTSCPGDCGACPPACGDGACNGCETCDSCAQDCGACGQCAVDADCVPAAVCHPSTCTLKAASPVCGGYACDASCQPLTLDCGQGSCACQAGQCVAVLNEAVCGDGACNGCETCDSCPADCGACGQCVIDADCVPSPACHATTCTLGSQVAPLCNLVCDGSCFPATLDCGQGKCACQSGQCVALISSGT